jgi:ferredoxin-NADP reductase
LTVAAVQRLRWLVARVVTARAETAAARTVVFEVPGWPGHLPGQHVDLRLTAEDGYSTQRSYSIAAPSDGERVELTVQQVPDGEVSPFLVEELAIGDLVEMRGPVGGWFVWRPEETAPVLLVGGGSGIVPLMAMVRERARVRSRVPFRLIYSVRTPGDVYYADELHRRVRDDHGLDVSVLFTRSAAEGTSRPPGRITPVELSSAGWPADFDARSYICGPTGFVETVAQLLLAQGHEAATIRTERFGPSGG